MKAPKLIHPVTKLSLVIVFIVSIQLDINSQSIGPIIIDHTCRDLAKVPEYWITRAKEDLKIIYAHSSHGSQIIAGMEELSAFADRAESPLNFSEGIFSWTDWEPNSTEEEATPGEIYIRDFDGHGGPDHYINPEGARDLGAPNDMVEWATDTRNYLGSPDTSTGRGINENNTEINVVMWAWCGTLSLDYIHNGDWTGWNDDWDSTTHTFNIFEGIPYDLSEGSDLRNLLIEIGYNNYNYGIGAYLLEMSLLEQDYPGINFVYMTGHADGSGLNGILNKHNEIIRNYCNTYNKVLYDFADIESYDPDGNYYGDKLVDDGCNFDADGDDSLEVYPVNNGYYDYPDEEAGDSNWAFNWQSNHIENVDWYDCQAAHSTAINGNLKAYATWWMWARLGGWEGDTSEFQYPDVDTTIYISICENDSILLNNSWQKISGVYIITLLAENGADSIVHAILNVIDNSQITINESICEGQSYYAGGADQTSAGIYYDTLINLAGCDSIVTTNLTVNSVSTSTVNKIICEGESYFVGGANQTSSGNYYDTLENTVECDSVIITNLMVDVCSDIPKVEFNEIFKIYPNPVQSELFIEIIDKQLKSFQLYNLSGLLILNYEYSTDPNINQIRYSIDLSEISKGIYLCKFKFDNDQSKYCRITIW
ncbi:T9SS type A sorting domain-containing protein [Bacteroidota bacterium]